MNPQSKNPQSKNPHTPKAAAPTPISAPALRHALTLRDLSDPSQGPHAMQTLVADAVRALEERWGCRSVLHRGSPLVAVEDNYDRLGYGPDAAARDARYTRYVTEELALRTHTSAMIPSALRVLSGEPDDVLLACPGLVYRRDCIDRLHVGEPHQLDLWRVRSGAPLTTGDLAAMVARVVETLLPGSSWRVTAAEHPYTAEGQQIDVQVRGQWVEVGECGLASSRLLEEAGLPGATTGLAMGLGLDRLLMIRKGIEDIRLLRSADPRVACQLEDLSCYEPVSSQPALERDLSMAVSSDVTIEDLGDRVREALGPRARDVEAVELVSETAHADLPPAAIERLGLSTGQKNVLVRVVLRHLERALTHSEANILRDKVYAAIHEGRRYQWAARAEPGRGTVLM